MLQGMGRMMGGHFGYGLGGSFIAMALLLAFIGFAIYVVVKAMRKL